MDMQEEILKEPVGFSTPIYDAMEAGLNVHELLVKNPPATFFVRASGDLPEERIAAGDILIVDRSLTPKKESLVVAVVDGEFVVKKMERLKKNYEFQVWGVITYVIHRTR